MGLSLLKLGLQFCGRIREAQASVAAKRRKPPFTCFPAPFSSLLAALMLVVAVSHSCSVNWIRRLVQIKISPVK